MHIVYVNMKSCTFLHLQCKEETQLILLMVIIVHAFIQNVIRSELQEYAITNLHK
jgi:hypothetical protein